MEDAIEITPRGLALRVSLCLRGGPACPPSRPLGPRRPTLCIGHPTGQRNGAADAKSMLDLLSLAPPADAELTLLAQGDDAREALRGLASFLTTLQE